MAVLAGRYRAGALFVRFGAPAEVWVDEEAKKYRLRLALPGVDPSTVELKLLGNLLTISAERKASHAAKDCSKDNVVHVRGAYGHLGPGRKHCNSELSHD
ncbi:hypothetical protein SBA1_400016 [Candidatus Sulfotelmatobacter kueseliae]|uniref:ArsA HSP20-like domain-containing protein n=1 Tax=Candidatus Sulfotelmatobacter kueseliae TaxID=2042962 RepID=A0A2U3KQF0_9BACT|nr:hypothetical protein SBA1_400016 [Candidatus Sulfotelmatobacter kueseliae]